MGIPSLEPEFLPNLMRGWLDSETSAGGVEGGGQGSGQGLNNHGAIFRLDGVLSPSPRTRALLRGAALTAPMPHPSSKASCSANGGVQGTDEERLQASRILPLVTRHHFLLVTLLLFNSLANEVSPDGHSIRCPTRSTFGIIARSPTEC